VIVGIAARLNNKVAPHARKNFSLPPTGGRMPPWGGPAEA
jgi:hypothetical protein